MNRIIFILTLSIFLFSQEAEITNIQAAQRTDGSQIVDITYDLLPDPIFDFFEIIIFVSIDGGDNFYPMNNVTGDLGDIIEPGNGKILTWNFGQQFGGTYSNQIKIKIQGTSYALADNNNNQELPFEMVTVASGEYTFGENDEIRNIDYDYEIMKYPVTDMDYVLFMLDKINNYNSNMEGCVDFSGTFLDGGELGDWSCEEVENSVGGCEPGELDLWGWCYNSCEWFLIDENNQINYDLNGYDACCICGGGTSNPLLSFSVNSNNATGYYPGDSNYPAGDYSYINFSNSKISWNGEILEVEEGNVNHPVTGVTWFGAWAFATHYGMEVPNQYEWEKAARSNTGFDYPWGNTISRAHANYNTFDNLIFIDGAWFDGWIEFGYSAANGSPIMTTPVELYDGNNSITNNIISDDLEHLVAVGLGNSDQYYYEDGENGSTLNIPFTIDNECTDVILGLWDTFTDQGGTYQITNMDQSQIISSNTIDIGTMGCSPQNSQNDAEEWQDICENMGAYDHSGDTNDPWSVENNFYVIELECLDIGQYNFNYTAFSGNPSYFITDIIAFIDILNPIDSDIITIDGASPYGLYDMAGNTWEIIKNDNNYFIRGGAYNSNPLQLRSWYQESYNGLSSTNNIGFRCLRVIDLSRSIKSSRGIDKSLKNK